MDTDVLVVGAGPTGLMLANQFARRGVRATIIDRHNGPSLQTRALGVQARTLEIYAHLGIVERALEWGKRATGANLWTQGRRAARVPLGDIGRDLSPYPFLLILGQDDNERLLGEALRKWGIDVQWNTELVALRQEVDHVVATVKVSNGVERDITAAWVAGCDGAHSAVRRLNGIEFQGAPYEHVFFVADTQASGLMVPDELNVYLWPQGFHLFFPMRGSNHWRVVGIVPPELREKADLTFDDVAPSVRAEAGAGLSFHSCTWFSPYRIHHRRAQRFRSGRCFLLGDAAHIHSPVGAQGMNTGLQDAYNLAWKLALVVSGRASETLLDSYADERVPVAEQLLSTTDRAFSLVVADRRFAGFFRTRVMPKLLAVAMRSERIRQLAFRTISQIGIRYPHSPLSVSMSGLPEAAPVAGDRFPWMNLQFAGEANAEDLFAKLDDTRFHLLLFGQPAPPSLSEVGELLRIHAIADSAENHRELEGAHIPRPSFFLLRPDGHVGLAGITLDRDAIARYFRERLRLSIPAA
jgi:2-polyprenyl-6-methoxyphenol hydroxylase-like FAD-dependent oxidoreductase